MKTAKKIEISKNEIKKLFQKSWLRFKIKQHGRNTEETNRFV